MKWRFLFAVVIAITVSNVFAQGRCNSFLKDSQEISSEAINDFMFSKFGVTEGQIVDIKQEDYREKDGLGSSILFYTVATVTSPLWAPILAYVKWDERKYDCVLKCSRGKNTFIGQYNVTYHDDRSLVCSLRLQFKSVGSMVQRINFDSGKIVKTVVSSHERPVCK